MGCLALADIPDFRDSPLGAHPPHVNVDGWKGLLAWPSSSQSLSGVGGQAFSTGPLAPQPVSGPGLGPSCLCPQRLRQALTQQVRGGETRGPTGFHPLWPCHRAPCPGGGAACPLESSLALWVDCGWGSRSLRRASVAPRPLLGSPTRGLVKPASPLQPGQECGPCARVGDLLCHHSMPASSAGAPCSVPLPSGHAAFASAGVWGGLRGVWSLRGWCGFVASVPADCRAEAGTRGAAVGRGGVAPPPAGFGVLRTGLRDGGRAHGLRALEASLGGHAPDAPGSQVCPRGGALAGPGTWWAGLSARSSLAAVGVRRPLGGMSASSALCSLGGSGQV